MTTFTRNVNSRSGSLSQISKLTNTFYTVQSNVQVACWIRSNFHTFMNVWRTFFDVGWNFLRLIILNESASVCLQQCELIQQAKFDFPTAVICYERMFQLPKFLWHSGNWKNSLWVFFKKSVVRFSRKWIQLFRFFEVKNKIWIAYRYSMEMFRKTVSFWIGHCDGRTAHCLRKEH